MNSIFQRLSNKQPTQQTQAQQPDMNKLYQQFQKNPMKYLSGLGIPQNMSDPRQMVQYLADNGKIPPMLQNKVNAMLGRK